MRAIVTKQQNERIEIMLDSLLEDDGRFNSSELDGIGRVGDPLKSELEFPRYRKVYIIRIKYL